ncbi:hypothetical protein [Sphingomonas faeni]|uniref:hypothetical protein n=1 Tax=Sphingomonas faeni TaxID=185950 RepID=UPI00334F8AAE
MVTTPQAEEPGFESDVNELPDDNNGREDTLEDKPIADEQEPSDLEDAQKE